MGDSRILLVCTLGNPLATTWLMGLRQLGRVAVVEHRRPRSPDELRRLGVADPRGVAWATEGLDDAARRAIREHLDGDPDVVVSWWGSGVLPIADAVHRAFPHAAWAHVINTLPNAANVLTEVREVLRYRTVAGAVDGFVYNSRTMQRMLERRVPAARTAERLVMIDPLPLRAYVDPEAAGRGRGQGPRPRLIFIGRSDFLYKRDPRMRKDALGPLLERLLRADVDVCVSDMGNGEALRRRGYSTYPRLSHLDVLDGGLAELIDGFDAHLVAYRVANATIRRRVSTALSTRLSSGLTATTPMFVNREATFLTESWDHPDDAWAAPFGSADELAAKVHDRALRDRLSRNLAAVHRSFAMDHQVERIGDFLTSLRARTPSSR